ncbi:MAG: ComEA family DNA-binding protein, partial [Actinobacteria bacterium]|nr:ComEA family DNA-binding protein [Actinomycetota bacterium]
MELPDRPIPSLPLRERARAWIAWVGSGRLAASALAVLAVLAGGYWLVEPPAATTDSKLPYAGSAATVATTTPPDVAGIASTTSVNAGALIVHVAGAVNAPGVYQLDAGSRVIDAVQIAGGLASTANADGVNLAALIADGQRVYVPAVGEVPPPIVTGDGGVAVAASLPININSASAAQLEALPGVGPATAAAIVARREQFGPFASVDALADVRGIGPAKLEAIRPLA